jgi:hypothetical protein
MFCIWHNICRTKKLKAPKVDRLAIKEVDINRREMLRKNVSNMARESPAMLVITEGLRGWLQKANGAASTNYPVWSAVMVLNRKLYCLPFPLILLPPILFPSQHSCSNYIFLSLERRNGFFKFTQEQNDN